MLSGHKCSLFSWVQLCAKDSVRLLFLEAVQSSVADRGAAKLDGENQGMIKALDILDKLGDLIG